MSIAFHSATLPVLHTCQAAVVGGGFAGIGAALALARAGRSVVLIEPRTYLGREVTATLRPWFEPAAADDTPTLIASCIEQAGRPQPGGEVALNLDALKIHLEDVLLQAGVRLLYASVVVGLYEQDGQPAGIVIGNKSGRQVIECELVLDTTETATVARLAGERFASLPHERAPFRRTLELDGVAALDPDDYPFGQPLILHGQQVILHRGYRDTRHVLVECPLDLPQYTASGFDVSARELEARRQTMDFVATLTADGPFAPAYLSGASYELYGPQTARLAADAVPGWLGRQAGGATLVLAGVPVALSHFAGRLPGLWYLGDATRPDALAADAFWNPALAAQAGEALGLLLAEHWQATSSVAPVAATATAPAPAADDDGPRVREPESPQRGRAYRRVPVAAQPLPVLREVDALVVGGGSSGAIAAITAAREGISTVLVEMNPGLGGTGTFGGVHSYWFGRRDGFSGEVMRLVNEMHTYIHHPAATGVIPKWNIEAKSFALGWAAHEAGADILFNAFVIGALVEGDRVCGVVVATREGPVALRARVVIDASGDGDVAAFAGAEFQYGNERDHATMWYALAQFTRPGLTRNHFTSTVDVSNIEDYTRAILAGRRRGGKGDMHDHGIYIAPRESRHILGEVVQTLNDQLLQRRWPDVVNIAFSNHDVKGHSGSDWIRAGLIPPNLEIEIPYRILLPRRLENILVVGKAVSATHDALPAIRMQADLENLGGVAALAAALAVRAGVPPRAVEVRALQARLIEAGVLPPSVLGRSLAPRHDDDAALERLIDQLGAVYPFYHYADMELTDIFEGDIPLVEVCCAGPRVIPLLERALARATTESRRLALAQALALVGATGGVPVLVDALLRALSGPELPPRTGDIRHSQLPPDQGAMPDPAYLLYSLGMAPDERALPVWRRVVELLAGTEEADFYDGLKGTFYYVDALCYGTERLATADLIPLLQQVHGYQPFHNQSRRQGFEPDYVQERLAYLELTLGRALARCGSPDGFIILISYLDDARALLAEYAHTELTAITGDDRGKDAPAWSEWLEANGDRLEPTPWQGPTEPMAAWGEPLLVPAH